MAFENGSPRLSPCNKQSVPRLQIYLLFFVIALMYHVTVIADTEEIVTVNNEFGGETLEISKDDFSILHDPY